MLSTSLLLNINRYNLSLHIIRLHNYINTQRDCVIFTSIFCFPFLYLSNTFGGGEGLVGYGRVLGVWWSCGLSNSMSPNANILNILKINVPLLHKLFVLSNVETKVLQQHSIIE